MLIVLYHMLTIVFPVFFYVKCETARTCQHHRPQYASWLSVWWVV